MLWNPGATERGSRAEGSESQERLPARKHFFEVAKKPILAHIGSNRTAHFAAHLHRGIYALNHGLGQSCTQNASNRKGNDLGRRKRGKFEQQRPGAVCIRPKRTITRSC